VSPVWRKEGSGIRAAVKAAVALVSVLVLLIASAATASPAAPPAGTSTVLCKRKTFPGRLNPTDPGRYSYQPSHCVVEVRRSRLPETKRFQSFFGIKWHRWDAGSAEASAKIPIRTEDLKTGEEGWGLSPVTLTLSRPVNRCGHLVFSHAEISHFIVTASYSLRLDRVPILGRGCPPG
jgi:hypothetical protein